MRYASMKPKMKFKMRSTNLNWLSERIRVLSIGCLLLPISLIAQEPDNQRLSSPLQDTLPDAQQIQSVTENRGLSAQDTLPEGEGVVPNPAFQSNWFTRDYPDPRKAGLFSLILPGTGQLYNKRWWKVPLVYGAYVGAVMWMDYNQDIYREFRTALDLKRKDEPHNFSGSSIDNIASLRSLRDRFDRSTQTAYVLIAGVHLLQAMEAFVDAHLKSFDVKDDLGGMQLRPQFEAPSLGTPMLGLGLSIPLHRSTSPPRPGAAFWAGP